MKILLCSHTGVFKGGAERSLLLLAEELKTKKVNCIISIPDNSQELLKEIKKLKLKYIVLHKDSDKRSINEISILTRQLKLLRRFLFTYKMYRFIRTHDIDIVYLNTLRTTSEYLAAKMAGKKTVMHIRGFDTKSNIRFKLLFKLDRIITLSNHAKRIVSKNIKYFKGGKVLVIPNGVRVNPFQNKIFIKNKIKIVFIGGYEYIKGVDYFFEIATNLLHSNINIQIIHIGEPLPKDDFAKKTLTKYPSLFENPNFIELGFVKNVTDHIEKCDIFLMTSRSEGMPRALLEAMERGLIPIVSDIDGLKNVIRNSVNGFIINLNNIEYCINEIKRIISNIEQLDYISKNARRDIVTKYNIESTNVKIIDALTKWS